jgi:eukaryotic-like serine/threonine-protein kinase
MKYCDQCRSSYPNDFKVCPMDNNPLRVASELFPGITIRDKYLILDKLGEGGMGTVYSARHLIFNETRALKVVHSSLVEDRSFVKRFKSEAIVSRKLQHPNAVRIEDFDTTDDGRPFIVMEMVEGTNLKKLISQSGVLPVARALSIAAQTADALGAAHKLGIIHRDVKPDNILITTGAGGDLVKVADFGIAKVREGTIDVGTGYTATLTGMIVGTPQYLSPEQAMGMPGDQIDGRADLYSLGIVLYVMLTGKLPFDSDTPMGFLMHHAQTTPVAPHVVRPDLHIPPEVSALLMKALEKDRNRRFSCAEEMALALRSFTQPAQKTKLFSEPGARAPEQVAAAAAVAPRDSQAVEERQRVSAEKPRLEEEPRLAAQKALLQHQQEQERKAAQERAQQLKLDKEHRPAEKSWLEEQGKLAAEKARGEEQERERLASEERARKQKLNEERRATVEQARLEVERKFAAEKAQRKQVQVPDERKPPLPLDQQDRLGIATDEERNSPARARGAALSSKEPFISGELWFAIVFVALGVGLVLWTFLTKTP